MSYQRAANTPRTISIFAAFSIFLVFVVCLLGLFSSVYFNRSIHNLLKKAQDQELDNEANNIKRQVKNYLSTRIMILQDFASFPLLNQVVMQPEVNLRSGSDFIDSLSLLRSKPKFLILDFESTVLTSSFEGHLFDYTLDDSIQEILNGEKTYTTSINVNEADFFLRIGVPIKYIDNVEGVLIAEIPIFEIIELFNSPELIKGRYYEFLVDDHTISTLGRPNEFTSIDIPIDNIGLTVRYRNDQSEFLVEEKEILQKSLLIPLLVTVVALFMAMFLIKKLFVIPLHHLQAASESMTKGQQISTTPTNYRVREFKILSEYFNTMMKTIHERTKALKQAHDEMEAKVKTRTKELEQTNENLSCEIKEREELSISLARYKDRLELATSSAAIGVWDWNILNNELTWDDRMFKLYRINESDFSNSYEAWQNILHPEDRDRVHEKIELAIDGKIDFDTDFRVVWPNKSTRTIKAYGFVQRDENGKALRIIGVNWDITEKKEFENSLKKHSLELEAKNKELDDFAYIASHDLKAPLRAIDNLSQWIEEDLEDHFTKESRKNMERLRGRVERMERLINDLLEYSRVGRKEYRSEMVDVNEIVEEIRDLISPPSGFAIKISEKLPVFSTKVPPLKQVFSNLIGNSIKHHHHPSTGQIMISSVEFEELFQFQFQDNGPGIPPEQHINALKMFQTLKPRDEVEGSGMGLALVEKIVKNYGGTLKLASQINEGLTVSFSWPKADQG